MKWFVLFALVSAYCYCCTSSFRVGTIDKIIRREKHRHNRLEVINYLVEYGYLESLNYNKRELKRAIRHLQTENNLVISGRINRETKKFVRNERDKKMVIEYLKNFNYILGSVTPLKIVEATIMLQENSGVLNVTGLIDTQTINFVKTNQHHGYSEGLVPPSEN